MSRDPTPPPRRSPERDPVRPGEPRRYRRIGAMQGLCAFGVRVEETDLWVQATGDLSRRCRERVIELREHLTRYIRRHPAFQDAMGPVAIDDAAPALVRSMAEASAAAGVGPMAAVAGAIAEAVGRDLLEVSGEVVVENGGDLFLGLERDAVVGLYAGPSPLSMKVGLRVRAGQGPLGLCTSSASVGHSRSLGRADAACILSPSASLADAAATAAANRVHRPGDVSAAVEWARGLEGVLGAVVVKADRIGIWGALEVVPLQRKRA